MPANFAHFPEEEIGINRKGKSEQKKHLPKREIRTNQAEYGIFLLIKSILSIFNLSWHFFEFIKINKLKRKLVRLLVK